MRTTTAVVRERGSLTTSGMCARTRFGDPHQNGSLASGVSFPRVRGQSIPQASLHATPPVRLRCRSGGRVRRASEGDCISVQQCIPIYVDPAAPPASAASAYLTIRSYLSLLSLRTSTPLFRSLLPTPACLPAAGPVSPDRGRACRGGRPLGAAVPPGGAGASVRVRTRARMLGVAGAAEGLSSRRAIGDRRSATQGVVRTPIPLKYRRELARIPALSSRDSASGRPQVELYFNCSREGGTGNRESAREDFVSRVAPGVKGRARWVTAR